ncbi:MAG: carbohydrate-binding domain-containing protein, partial [Clostridiales bacterium]|nr:carbohydrate-binding domain-containing protein [Candidatus Coliplasma equi]
MKNRILSVLLAALMLALLLPFAALSVFAGEEDLTITKNGVLAEEDEDYGWYGVTLSIYSDGITVSGKMENVIIRCQANDLTFENLYINCSESKRDTVCFENNCVLYLKGDNCVSNTNGSYSAIYATDSLEIAGDGNLDVYSAHDGIYAEGCLTVSASGKINVDVAHGAVICWTPTFRETVNMFFAHGKGEDCGVLWSGDCVVIGDGLGVKGSADYVDSIG